EDLFKSFCAFGADKHSSQSAAAMLDGAKFAKMAKDLKLLDKQFTTTDVDIIFTKVKPKTERKITYAQFEEALKLMAAKKYPGAEDGLEKLKGAMLQGKGPAVHGVTKTVKNATVDRLTDASKFTGIHKERFDDEGKGKGLAGRKEVVDESGYVTGYKEKG
ncbi:hypothetical protein HELRODRAFT_135395, partial [Helobdella robusta]|uniref:Tubulin polymerization-promoting protein family member 3 n=1 Tax=Helobdella robusta TaxID=6412 RepID=T1EI86_HELRO